MVPRPIVNGELAHRHIVTMSSSTGTGRLPLFITQSSGGVSSFGTTGFASPNMALSWSLADMVVGIGGAAAITIPNPNIAELQQLYDTFQIDRVDIKVYFGNTESLVSGDPTSGIQWTLPIIGYSVDNDDAGNTSITQLQQYSTYKSHQSSKPMQLRLVPTAAGTVFDPSVASNAGYTRLQKQDINVAYASTPHYGLKLAVDGFLANPPALLNFTTYMSVEARVHYIMKCTR